MNPEMMRWKSVPSYSGVDMRSRVAGWVHSRAPSARSAKFATVLGAWSGNRSTVMSPWLVCSTARRAGVDSVTAPLCHRSVGHDRPVPAAHHVEHPGGGAPAAGRTTGLRCRRHSLAPGGSPMTVDQTSTDRGFLRPAPPSAAAEQLFAGDREEAGYVMNISHAWAHLPGAQQALMDQLKAAAAAAGLSFRQRGVLVAASAAGLGDPHCSLAWGRRLADEAGD